MSARELYGVNEKCAELLDVAGKQYLMMGNQPGNVTPNAERAEQNRPLIVQVQMPQGGVSRDTARQFGRMVGSQINLSLARNG